MRFRPVPPHPEDPPLSVVDPWRMAAGIGIALTAAFVVLSLLGGGGGLPLVLGSLLVLVLGALGGRAVAWEDARRWRLRTSAPPERPAP